MRAQRSRSSRSSTSSCSAGFVRGLPALEAVVVVEGARGSDTEGWDTVEGADPGFDPGPHWRAVQAQDVLTLIYTSGTTGPRG